MADSAHPPKRGPFVVTATRDAYRNAWISVREDKVVRPDGRSGLFGVVEVQPGATVLALDRDRTVVLAREYKYGVDRVTLEAVSGGIDPEETPLAAAQRELAEELGLKAETWTWLGELDPLTSVIVAPNHVFLAEGLSACARQHDAGEVIEPVRLPFEEAFRQALQGGISHAATVVAILKTALLLSARKA